MKNDISRPYPKCAKPSKRVASRSTVTNLFVLEPWGQSKPDIPIMMILQHSVNL